jgi:hypothetical protein
MQYGHLNEWITEGYASTSQNTGFHSELRMEQDKLRLKDIGEVYEDAQKGKIAAGATHRLSQIVEADQNELTPFVGEVSTSTHPTAKKLRSFATVLYPGPMVDCHFSSSDLALCLQDTKDRERPIPERCNPFKCCNALCRPKHAAAIDQHLASIQEMKKVGKISRLQKEALNTEQQKWRSVLERIRGD